MSFLNAIFWIKSGLALPLCILTSLVANEAKRTPSPARECGRIETPWRPSGDCRRPSMPLTVWKPLFNRFGNEDARTKGLRHVEHCHVELCCIWNKVGMPR